MKKLLSGLFVFIILISFGFSQDWQKQNISWNSGEAMSDTLISAEADTSDWFRIPTGVRNKVKYPETLSFMLIAIQTVTTDFTEMTFALQLSNDRTYIHSYGTLFDFTGVADVDVSVEDKIVTDLPLFEFGRIIATGSLAGGDSVSCKAQLTKDFSNY